MNEESVLEYMFFKVVQSRRSRTRILKMRRCNARTTVPHPNFQNGTRHHIFRIHHHVFMDEESVPEYMVLKVVHSRRSCTLILKMGRCNAITHLSHPPPPFYNWGEYVKVYVFQSSSVQAVLHPNLENGTLQRDNTFFASTTSFLWLMRVSQSVCV